MPEPARSDRENVVDPWDMLGRMTDLIDHLRLDTVEQAREHGFARLPDNAEDRDRDQQADQRIGNWKAKPHAEGSHDNGEARQAVGACVIAVRYQRRALNLAADADPENGACLVTE